jgi:hypothetical protein
VSTPIYSKYRRGHPDGPPCAWLVDPGGESIYPAFLFCKTECRAQWVRDNVRRPMGVNRGNLPFHLIQHDDRARCAQCEKRIWRRRSV